jgi:DNA-directed RNA polymerase subunit RPC12/RpoP
MALIKCHECGGQVSDQAWTCPHCGAPVIVTIHRGPKAVLVSLAIRLALGLFLGMIAWIVIQHFLNQSLAPLRAIERQQQQSH